MAIDLEVRVEADEALEAVEDWGERASDLRVPFRVFDREVSTFARRQFDTAGRHGGQPWEPVLPSTVASRAQNRGGAEHPLWDTGELRASLVEVGPRSVRRIGRDRYTRGSLVPYAPFAGDPEGSRPIFPDPVPRELTEKLEGTLAAWFEGRGVFGGF